MKRNNVVIIIIAVAILGFLAGNYSYPKYFNQGMDYLNARLGLAVPHFFDVPFRMGLDLEGGVQLLYDADLSKVNKADYNTAMQGLRDVIERRVNLFGVQEPVVQVEEAGDHYRLLVELAGVQDPAQAIKMIGETPFLEFREQRSSEETQMILDKQKEVEGKSLEEAQNIPDWQLALEDPNFKPTDLNGRYLERSELAFDQTTYRPSISIKFNKEGTDLFKDLTGRNIGKPLAIYIDNILISAPVVQEAIAGGEAQITGQFTVEEAKTLARNLSAGALPVPINLISQQKVGPTLGASSLEKSLKAGIYGFLAIVIFMIIFYKLPGLLAAIALFIYVVIILSIFKLIPVTLTLAGIGGFVLSIGMAIDANILIFARLKEELAENKDFSTALEEAFRRAWPSIRDSNLTSLIVGFILFSLGTSFIKGFALTLSLGIIVSMFSAIFITRQFLRIFIGTRFEKYKKLWTPLI
ncbi:MAG: protein translocase subunit SecD [Candidatus Parcubacteria bacterium]|nr:protein translocase subunit SecD [Candidatus Parcubacteria bacterium]